MHREIVGLAILVGVTIVAFLVTRSVAANNEDLRRQQAAMWFETAQDALQSGNLEPAVVTLRRAVSRDPENEEYGLALARALAESRLDDEARRVLFLLREAEPEEPETNLQLARIEARGSDADASRRYYESALAGLWQPERAEERRAVRLELIDFLLARGERDRALSELLVLDASLPADTAAQVQVGRLFLSADDPRQALNRFEGALAVDPDDGSALAGAGESAFALGDYARARRYLNAAPRDDERIAELREVTQFVLSGDPLAPRLAANERRRRLLAALQQATQTLEVCLVGSLVDPRADLESLRTEAIDFEAAVVAQRRGDIRDLIDDGVDLIYRIERSMEPSCRSVTTSLDRALLLIGRVRGFEQP